MATTAAATTPDDKPKKKELRDGVLIKFRHPYGVWQLGDKALFDDVDARRLCGVGASTPNGSEGAVAQIIGYNAAGKHHEASTFPAKPADKPADKPS